MRASRRSFAAVLASAIFAAGAAHAVTPRGGVYCVSGIPALQFAGRFDAKGDLTFGLSVWDTHGNNSFMKGTARKSGNHWLYVSEEPDGYLDNRPPCRLTITFDKSGALTAVPDPKTACTNHDGWRKAVLPKSSYQGPVTVELDETSSFFEDPPALLGKGECFKQNPG